MADLPLTFPLPAPEVTPDGLIQLDALRNDPQEIVDAFAGVIDAVARGWVVDRIFRRPPGLIAGGAVRYTPRSPDDLLLDPNAGPRLRNPGAESALMGGRRQIPRVSLAEPWSGRFIITDEAVETNNYGEVIDEMTLAANSFMLIVNQRGFAVLNAFLTQQSRDVLGQSWADLAAGVASATDPVAQARSRLAADFALVNSEHATDYGIPPYDTLIANPIDMLHAQTIMGDQWQALLASHNITEAYTSNLQPVGQPLFLASGQVGDLAYQQDMQVETDRGPVGTFRADVAVQTKPLFIPRNAGAAVRLNGTNA